MAKNGSVQVSLGGVFAELLSGFLCPAASPVRSNGNGVELFAARNAKGNVLAQSGWLGVVNSWNRRWYLLKYEVDSEYCAFVWGPSKQMHESIFNFVILPEGKGESHLLPLAFPITLKPNMQWTAVKGSVWRCASAVLNHGSLGSRNGNCEMVKIRLTYS